MGNNPKGKRTGMPAAAVKANDKAKERRFQWWQLIVGEIVALLVALIPLFRDSLKPTPPEFALVNPIQRPDSAIMRFLYVDPYVCNNPF